MTVSAANLAAAFETFNQTAERLKEAYGRLQEKIAQLDRELEEKNRQLSRKVDELNRTRNYLNDILEAMTDGVVAIDAEGNITTFNNAAQRISGYAADEVMNRSYSEIFGDGFGDVPRLGFRWAPSAGHTAAELRTKGGATVPVSESVALLTNQRGDVAGAVKVFQDLSEVVALREEVREKDRLAAVGQLAATVAHEIRNPLGGIEGFAALLARDIHTDDPRSVLVEKIRDGARSLNRVVSELLAFTRPMVLKPTEVDCENLLRSVIALAGESGKGINVSVDCTPTGEPALIVADSEMVGQAFLNIVLNAFQSMPDGGELRIGISREQQRDMMNGSLTITFVDTGSGIPEEVLPRIFEPFFTTKQKGTGLGLSVAARIIEGHGGRITAKNNRERGACFEICLPCKAQHHARVRIGGDDGC